MPPTAAVSPLVIEAGGVRKLPSPCLKLWEEEGNASDQCSEKAGRPQESPRQSAGIPAPPPSPLYLLQNRCQKSPDTPGSPEGNTEGPGSASSEPLLPS